jgi:hypothetical protein
MDDCIKWNIPGKYFIVDITLPVKYVSIAEI